MKKLRRDTRKFKDCALNSLLLAIEIFNRPYEIGRTEAVLILLQHAFEMLLKSAIYQNKGTISDSRSSMAFGFDRCLGTARSNLSIINEDQAQTLAILAGLRDCATHNLIELSEQALYIHAQVAVTLFNQMLSSVFDERLADHMPTRILPISTSPPEDMVTFLDSEFTQIQALLGPGKRRRSEVRGRLRHLIIMDTNLSGEPMQPTEREIERILHQVKTGNSWQAIFPGIASVRLDIQAHGPAVSFRFTRDSEAAPVRIVREGMPDFQDAELVREVNLMDRYSMTPTTFAQNVGLSNPRCLALIRYLSIQTDPDCYKEFNMGKSSIYKRYSVKALDRIKEALDTVDMEAIWREYGPHGGPKPKE